MSSMLIPSTFFPRPQLIFSERSTGCTPILKPSATGVGPGPIGGGGAAGPGVGGGGDGGGGLGGGGAVGGGGGDVGGGGGDVGGGGGDVGGGGGAVGAVVGGGGGDVGGGGGDVGGGGGAVGAAVGGGVGGAVGAVVGGDVGGGDVGGGAVGGGAVVGGAPPHESSRGYLNTILPWIYSRTFRAKIISLRLSPIDWVKVTTLSMSPGSGGVVQSDWSLGKIFDKPTIGKPFSKWKNPI